MADEFHRKLTEALAAAGKLDPAERFERMVRSGLINRRGELTRDHGGTADPDPSVQQRCAELIETTCPTCSHVVRSPCVRPATRWVYRMEGYEGRSRWMCDLHELGPTRRNGG